MRTLKFSELTAFAVAAIIGISAIVVALGFPRVPGAHSGPGGFPLFLGVALTALAGRGIAQSLRKEKTESASRGDRSHILPLGIAAILYLLLMPLLGFITATTLLCAAALIIHGYRNPARALAAGFIAAFILYGIFGLLMNVVLPKGWIG